MLTQDSSSLAKNEWLIWTFLLILAAFFWGSTFVLVKDAITNISPTRFLGLRFVGTFILSCLTIRFLYPDSWDKLLLNKYGWILGIFNFLSYLFQTIGLVWTTPSNAAFITGLNTPLLPLVLIYVFKQKIPKTVIIWALLAIIGLALLSLDFSTFTVNPGDLLIILTAICIVFQIIFTGIWSQKTSEGGLVLSQFASMAVFSVLSIIVFDGPQTSFIFSFNETVIFALIVTILFATLYAFYIQTAAQKRKIPSPYVAFIFALEPVFALVVSLLVGAETLSIQRLFGAAIMFLAIMGSIYSQIPKKIK